jgi:GT2 family glycosyltransferase
MKRKRIMMTLNLAKPKVTIVVSPRERFSYARESLESIYENTSTAFDLIYVDGGSPQSVQAYLEVKAAEKGFQLIRKDYYLSPNQARNLAIPEVKTPYILFIDNDVHVAPGWLGALLDCAEETNAAIVCPLTCIGKPLHQKIHLAGGEAQIVLEVKGEKTHRRVHEKHYFVNRPVADVQDQLYRQQCEFAEFHCMLVRTEIFNKTGLLDEALLSTREHIDFCLSVAQTGGKIYCEPASVVTYVAEPISQWSDISYFMLRWSDAWELSSLQHFRDKWGLHKDKYFKKRYNRLGYRRHQAFLKPAIRRFTFGRSIPFLENAVVRLERQFNKFVTDRYAQRHPVSPTPITAKQSSELVTK